MKSGSSGAFKSDRLGLSCKASKYSGAGTADLGVLSTRKTSQCFSLREAASTRPPPVNVASSTSTCKVSHTNSAEKLFSYLPSKMINY